MDVLVYGAGVIGSLYAARLQGAGNRVTVLARGTRLGEIRRHGLVLEDVASGVRSTAQVATAERLSSDDRFDIALIAVRREQLAEITPALTANRRIPTVLFMVNNPLGSAEMVRAFEHGRVLLGFPGAGGTRDRGVVQYTLIGQQPTTIGEPDGRATAPLRAVAQALRDSQRERSGIWTRG
ncbi:MAG TPA: 2-dehydropantoate 2-reductase N-terminal domain-containing protein [bacterium]|nr:2-dehydropantoate 2-reductase N-terminal domain-containing protein [bacterium]